MRASGYAEITSKNTSKLIRSKGWKQVAKPMIEKLDKEIERRMEALEKTDLKKEKDRDLVYSLDNLIKNKQLLSGQATEIIHNDFSELSNEELDRIAKEGESGDGKEGDGEEESSSVHPS